MQDHRPGMDPGKQQMPDYLVDQLREAFKLQQDNIERARKERKWKPGRTTVASHGAAAKFLRARR